MHRQLRQHAPLGHAQRTGLRQFGRTHAVEHLGEDADAIGEKVFERYATVGVGCKVEIVRDLGIAERSGGRHRCRRSGGLLDFRLMAWLSLRDQ